MRKGRRKGRDLKNLFCLFFIILVFFVIFSLLRGTYQNTKSELLNSLSRERRLNEENLLLKTELTSITRDRFLILLAREKLNLRKAKEEEIYVMR